MANDVLAALSVNEVSAYLGRTVSVQDQPVESDDRTLLHTADVDPSRKL